MSPTHIRQIRTRRDIAAVADLIELCFATTMDSDGREYVRFLRKLASGTDYSVFSAAALETRTPPPVRGFVWEEDGRIVGNLTLLYFFRSGRRYALIANVATHPDYRRRGIARELTLKALDVIQSRGLADAWLHVRDDNPAAIKLYLSLGFEERFRRTQWMWEPQLRNFSTLDLPGIKVGRRTRQDWTLQERWLDETYPSEMRWNLPIDKNRLRPSLMAALQRFLMGDEDRQLAARYQGSLIGVLSWQATSLYADNIWLACDPRYEERAANALLTTMTRHYHRSRPLSLNYPAGRLSDVLEFCGLYPHLTLIWMRKTF